MNHNGREKCPGGRIIIIATKAGNAEELARDGSASGGEVRIDPNITCRGRLSIFNINFREFLFYPRFALQSALFVNDSFFLLRSLTAVITHHSSVITFV